MENEEIENAEAASFGIYFSIFCLFVYFLFLFFFLLLFIYTYFLSFNGSPTHPLPLPLHLPSCLLFLYDYHDRKECA